ncbi:MAG: hypothetical protein R3D32_14880 [Nitratireductor sp.]
MKNNLVKTALMTAAVLLAAGVYTTPANAGGYGHHQRPEYRQHYQYGQQYYGGYHRYSVCEPGEAVYKARSLGLRHAGVERINRRVIVVSGRHRGHWASVVFDRSSRHCRILDARGI